MLITKHVRKIFTIIFVIFISILLGYTLRMHHEESIRSINQSQAEKDLATLEEEFYSAMKKPRSFFIFNGMFEVYPAKKNDRVFFYRKADNSSTDNIQVTKNTADKEIYNKDEQSVVVSDDPSLNDFQQ
ncbi:MAG: hypothetical protein HXY47_06530 [Nitrospirae bacterium]|nr:hypothetical protein [Nitrospirota bacterium]